MSFGAVRSAFAAVSVDQDYAKRLSDGVFAVRHPLRAWLQNPSLRAAFWMRLAAQETGLLRHLARARLLAAYSSDISGGCEIRGPLSIPHPTGIVLGQGVRLRGGTVIYQGVTLGADRRGRYPDVGADVVLMPNCMVIGGVRIGDGAIIGAMALVRGDVVAGSVIPAGAVVYRSPTS